MDPDRLNAVEAASEHHHHLCVDWLQLREPRLNQNFGLTESRPPIEVARDDAIDAAPAQSQRASFGGLGWTSGQPHITRDRRPAALESGPARSASSTPCPTPRPPTTLWEPGSEQPSSSKALGHSCAGVRRSAPGPAAVGLVAAVRRSTAALTHKERLTGGLGRDSSACPIFARASAASRSRCRPRVGASRDGILRRPTVVAKPQGPA